MSNTLLQNLYERFYMLVDMKMRIERMEEKILNSKNESASYEDIIHYINNVNSSIDSVRAQIKTQLSHQ